MIKVCPVCNEEFRAKERDQIFCCRECYEKNRRKGKKTKIFSGVCEHCGNEFTWEGITDKKRRFCSQACRKAAREEKSIKDEHDPLKFQKKLEVIKNLGMTYAEYQKAETLRMIAEGK